MQHIDRIIRSKNVFTAQDGIDTARELAIAIAGDRIVAVGAPDDVIAAAPAASYSLAMSRYGKCSAITPFEGDAFLTSQIKEIPGLARARRKEPLRLLKSRESCKIHSACLRISESGTCRISTEIRSLVLAAIRSRILLVVFMCKTPILVCSL